MTRQRLPVARRLRPDQFLRFQAVRRLCLRAEHGTLWITIDGRPDDITLSSGESRVIDATSPIVVGALDGTAVLSAVSLDGPTPAPASRLLAVVGRLFGRGRAADLVEA